MALKFLVFALTCIVLKEVSGHGMMLGPPNRSSLWRFDPTAPPNYDDNQNYCGGAGIQHGVNGGKCGVCGDSYSDPHPQKNENTGKYGQGKVVATYKSGQVIDTDITLTGNHMGTFEYQLCILKDPSTYEPEDCFFDLYFEDGSKQFPVPGSVREFKNRVKLPDGVTCERCVLRWHYTTGHNNGGHAPQENYRSCSDISIQ